MHLTLRDFSMGGYALKDTRHLKRIQRLEVANIIIDAVRDLPETTTCEGPLRDPRCPVSGNGDVTNILLAAFNKKGELKGALHFSAINLIERKDGTLVVETHPTPAFPSLSPTEVGTFALEGTKFVLTNRLATVEGPDLQIQRVNYALEIPFKEGGSFSGMHKAMTANGLELVTGDDPTRPGRNLHSFRIK